MDLCGSRSTWIGRYWLYLSVLLPLAAGLLAPPVYSENPSAPSDPLIAELTFYLDKDPSPLEGVNYKITPRDGSLENGMKGFVLDVELLLPKECGQLDALMDRWGGRQDGIDLRNNHGYQAFCSRMEFLSKGARVAKFDFVSAIDFTQIPLTLIPHEIACSGVSSREFFEYCDEPESRLSSICGEGSPAPQLNYVTFSLGWAGNCPPDRIVEHRCQLVDGEFLGEFVITNGEIDCIRDPEREGVALYDVQFRDMNNDGFMDAILSVVQRGPFSGLEGRVRFILTKTEADTNLIRISK